MRHSSAVIALALAASAGAQDLTIAWRLPLGGAILPPVAVTASRVAIVDREGRIRAFAADGPAVVAAATLPTRPLHALGAAGRLFVIDGSGRVHGLDAELDATWVADLEAPANGAPAAGGALLVVPVEGPALVAFDAASGAPLWRQTISGNPAAAPLVTPDFVAVPTTDGRLELRAPDGGAARPEQPFLGSADGVTPGFADDVLIAGGSGAPILGIDARSGRIRWRRHSGRGLSTTPLPIGREILVANLANQAILLKPDGNPLWWTPLPSRLIHPPVAWSDGIVMVATRSGELLVVAPGNGRIRHRLRAPADLGWFTSAPVAIADRILVAAGYGRRTELVAIERTPPPPPADEIVEPVDHTTPAAHPGSDASADPATSAEPSGGRDDRPDAG